MTAPTTTEVEDTRGDPFAWLADRTGWSRSTVEWVLGLLAAAAAVAVTAYMARDLWFTSDEWEYLTNREATSLRDLTRPIGGHTTFWSVLLLRGLYTAVGVDFWPWFYLPRLIGHTLLMIVIWRVLKARGTDPLVAFAAYAILLVVGASGYQRAIQIGTWLVYGALLLTAWVISRREEPTTRDKVLLAAALFVAILGNGYAVAVVLGITASLFLFGKLRQWWPIVIPALGLYSVLYVTHRDEIKPKPELKLGSFLEIPEASFRVVRTAIESATALPGFVAGVLTVALAAWIVSLLVRRRFDVFDSMFLLAVAAGLCALTIQRVSIDSEAATRLRYGYMVTVLLTVPLIRHVRLPRNLIARGAFCLVALGVLVANVDSLNEAIDVREAAGQEARGLTVAASGMVHAGEPLVEGPSELSHGLELDEFLDLIEEGYDPAPLPEERGDRDEIEAAARGALRMNLVDRRRPRERYLPEAGTPPTTTEAPVDDEGCVVLAEGEPVTFEVTGAAGLTFDKRRAQSLTLQWVDEYGEGIRHFDDVDVREGAVGLAEPETTAELTMTSPVDELTVCGVAEG